MAYALRYHPVARRQVDTLPTVARPELARTLEAITADPWHGEQFPDYPPEYPMADFGSWGIVVYLVRDRQQTVTILQITYAG